MALLMGGSGSTGSSLLKNILGRHSAIFGSQEMSLFAKKEVYDDWEKSKKKIFNRHFGGLKNHGFHRYNRIDFYPSELLIKLDQIRKITSASTTLASFTAQLFATALRQHSKHLWLEKTPANSCLFNHFLRVFPEGHVIHTTRHPLETIASLVRRGFNPYYATCVYLINTACGLSCADDERYIIVPYETLTADPKSTISDVLGALKLEYEDKVLHPNQEDHISVTKLSGWMFDETDSVKVQPKNRFLALSDEVQKQILCAIQFVKISETGLNFYKSKFRTVNEIANELDYELPDLSFKKIHPAIPKWRKADKRNRLLKGYWRHYRNYPIELQI